MESIPKNLSYDLAAVDGLEDLFNGVKGGVNTVTPDLDLESELTADSIVMWTLAETAENLGLSSRTVLRRLKTGALSGYKVTGENGPEWRIKPPSVEIPTNRKVEPTVKAVIGDTEATLDKTPDTTTALLKVIESQAEQLKAAAEVMSYQRFQLENRDNEIKLLTDRQTMNWWSRFSKWFLGQR